jgi:hypothetical protein
MRGSPRPSGSSYVSPNRGIVYETMNPDGSLEETQWWNNRPRGSSFNDMANPYPHAKIHSVAANGSAQKAAMRVSTLDKNGNEVQASEYNWIFYNIPGGTSIKHDNPGLGDVSSYRTGTLLRQNESQFVIATANNGIVASAKIASTPSVARSG